MTGNPGRRNAALALAVLLVLTVPVPAAAGTSGDPPAGTAAHGVEVTDVTLDPGQVVARDDNRTYLWRAGPHNLTVDVAGESHGDETNEVCVTLRPNATDAAHELDCRAVTLEGGAPTAVAFSLGDFPEGAGGPATLAVTVNGSRYPRAVLADAAVSVHVLRPDGDADGDGLDDRAEVERGTGVATTDSDGDSLADGTEVDEYGTDPLAADSDGDGLRDAEELARGTNATVADTDADGLRDGDEVERGTDPRVADTDADGLDDGREVELGTDPTLADTDDDGLADPAEVDGSTNATVADTDGDGLADGREADLGADPTLVDTDGDGLRDGLEVRLGLDPTGPPVVPVAGLLVLLGAAAALGRRRGWWRRGAGPGSDGDAADDADATATDPASDGPSEAAGPEAPAEGQPRVPKPAPPDGPDDPFRTDEDRVLGLLAERGGRMRQRRFPEATGWSKSKVSRLLSRMAEDGQVTKIDVGRENVIALPGHEPAGARAPFEESDDATEDRAEG